MTIMIKQFKEFKITISFAFLMLNCHENQCKKKIHFHHYKKCFIFFMHVDLFLVAKARFLVLEEVDPSCCSGRSVSED